MPRNNKDRMGVQDENPPLVAETNSILNFVVPTEFVELPTRGLFYPPEHPLHNVESVEIKHMTAKETDILSSKTLLKKGVAIDRMLQSIIVDSSIQVDDLYTGDKNALIIAARTSGFGEDYNASITCTNCSTVFEQEFNLTEVSVKQVEDDIKFTDTGTFFIELPQTKVNVECKLLTTEDEKRLLALLEKRQKLKLPESSLTDQYKSFIVSLNGVTERSTVEEFIDLMPARDANYLRKEYDRARPDVDLTHVCDCDNCGATVQVNIPFTANFFWPQ
jgi:hypothetical protein